MSLQFIHFFFIYTSFDRIQLGWIRSSFYTFIIKILQKRYQYIEITNTICPKIYRLILQGNIFKPAVVYQKSV